MDSRQLLQLLCGSLFTIFSVSLSGRGADAMHKRCEPSDSDDESPTLRPEDLEQAEPFLSRAISGAINFGRHGKEEGPTSTSPGGGHLP